LWQLALFMLWPLAGTSEFRPIDWEGQAMSRGVESSQRASLSGAASGRARMRRHGPGGAGSRQRVSGRESLGPDRVPADELSCAFSGPAPSPIGLTSRPLKSEEKGKLATKEFGVVTLGEPHGPAKRFLDFVVGSEGERILAKDGVSTLR
jgi:hypothetical protein